MMSDDVEMAAGTIDATSGRRVDETGPHFLQFAREKADDTNQTQTDTQLMKLMHASVSLLAFKMLLDRLPNDDDPHPIFPSNDSWVNRIVRCVYSELAHRKSTVSADASGGVEVEVGEEKKESSALSRQHNTVSDPKNDSYGGVISVHSELHSTDMGLFLRATATVQSLITMRQLFGLLLKPDGADLRPGERAYVSKLKLLGMTKQRWEGVTFLVLNRVDADVTTLCATSEFEQISTAWTKRSAILLAKFTPVFRDFENVGRVTSMLTKSSDVVIRETIQLLNADKEVMQLGVTP